MLDILLFLAVSRRCWAILLRTFGGSGRYQGRACAPPSQKSQEAGTVPCPQSESFNLGSPEVVFDVFCLPVQTHQLKGKLQVMRCILLCWRLKELSLVEVFRGLWHSRVEGVAACSRRHSLLGWFLRASALRDGTWLENGSRAPSHELQGMHIRFHTGMVLWSLVEPQQKIHVLWAYRKNDSSSHERCVLSKKLSAYSGTGVLPRRHIAQPADEFPKFVDLDCGEASKLRLEGTIPEFSLRFRRWSKSLGTPTCLTRELHTRLRLVWRQLSFPQIRASVASTSVCGNWHPSLA